MEYKKKTGKRVKTYGELVQILKQKNQQLPASAITEQVTSLDLSASKQHHDILWQLIRNPVVIGLLLVFLQFKEFELYWGAVFFQICSHIFMIFEVKME